MKGRTGCLPPLHRYPRINTEGFYRRDAEAYTLMSRETDPHLSMHCWPRTKTRIPEESPAAQTLLLDLRQFLHVPLGICAGNNRKFKSWQASCAPRKDPPGEEELPCANLYLLS